MTRVFRGISFQLLLLAWVANGQQPASPVPPLEARLDAELAEPRFAHAQWGIKVVSLDSGKTLFERNADKLMKPASNAKLYTAALALDRLGPDYRIKTSFYATAKTGHDGVLHSDLIVYGRGDPCFSARFNDGDYKKAIQPAVDAVLAAGIRQIDGDLVGDESYFHGPPLGSEWTWDDLQTSSGAPASALSFQDNVIDLLFKPGDAVGAPCQITTLPATSFMIFSNRTQTGQTNAAGSIRLYRPLARNLAHVWGGEPLGSTGEADSVSVNDPALWFVTMLKEALAEKGIMVSGGVREMNWLDRETAPLDLAKLTEVASVESRPLAEIVKQTLKPSENLYAQLLLLQVGATAMQNWTNRDFTTEEAGLIEMGKFLKQADVDPETTLLEEGSGLSRASLVTPSATVKLLTFMNRHRYRDAFLDGLPIAGVDGTLRNRLKGTSAAGNLRAKTGTLGYVSTLSGFVTDARKEKLVFSIMLNNYRQADPEHNGHAEIDRIIKTIINN